MSTLISPGELVAGRYQVVRELASGGMGTVFIARHVATERDVALKVLWPQLIESPAAREKFELEAKIAARVKTPHIVEVLDAGFDRERRVPFLVMELLHGSALSQVQVPLDVPTLLEYLAQIAEALDQAHGYVDAQGKLAPIVHRDLKPENIFVTELRGAPFLKVLDFGIAKVLSENTEHSQDLKGTPLFMAPEQARAQPVSPQTDIYALGLITYYLLTGKMYWRAAHSSEAKVTALLLEIVEGPPAPPSQRAREQGAEVTWPVAFDRWFLKCVAPDPAARFSAAGVAVRELGNALLRNQAPTVAGAMNLDDVVPSTEPAPIAVGPAPAVAPTATLPSEPPTAAAELHTSVSPLSSTRQQRAKGTPKGPWLWVVPAALLAGGLIALANRPRVEAANPVTASSLPPDSVAASAPSPEPSALPAAPATLAAEVAAPPLASSVAAAAGSASAAPPAKPATGKLKARSTPSLYDQRTRATP
jgi:serine/threonine-protein kinase